MSCSTPTVHRARRRTGIITRSSGAFRVPIDAGAHVDGCGHGGFDRRSGVGVAVLAYEKSGSVLREIDGLDIGWGGVQRWATAKMPEVGDDLHLDFACGVGTFLGELGWRHPKTRLVGLNIDFAGPHAPIRDLLTQAGVRSELVQADARRMPFRDGTLDSASCFLGLQDIEIGFGEDGMRRALREAVRVLSDQGTLTLLDAFPFERFDDLLAGLPIQVEARAERPLDVRWSREIAERAIPLYADGWVDQTRASDSRGREQIRADIVARMTAEMERQLSSSGFYVPFGPVRMVVATKTR